jgi:hypothetical protein
MSKLIKLFAVLALVAGTFAFTPNTASAQHWHGHGGGWHGGGWHGGGWGHRGWGWGPAVGFGLGLGWGPYYARPYYGPYPYYSDAYAEPTCGYVRVRVWRARHWVFRRAWRCW